MALRVTRRVCADRAALHRHSRRLINIGSVQGLAMLHEFLTMYRGAIIARARHKATARAWPPAGAELANGVPAFLTQLTETLRWESTPTPFSADAIGATAAHHGGELLDLGFTVSQVVHHYGDVCQAVTELAVEQNAPVSTPDFHVLNRCLDLAIAEAVTEHARLTAEAHERDEYERLGRFSHELANRLNTAVLAFDALERGAVGINGNTGAVLGRSLTGLLDMVDQAMSDIRMAASRHRPERVAIAAFIDDIGVAARLRAEHGGLRLHIDPVDPGWWANIDRQLLTSAVMNLLNNACNYTPAGGRVVLRVRDESDRILIEVEDECGGLPESRGDHCEPFAERRGNNRTGLGLGLSIARKAVRAQGGDIRVVNMLGRGCMFVIDVPRASDEEASTADDSIDSEQTG
jgi:signal transduction histidine kinase